MDEAIARDDLVIREKGGGQVPRIEVRNDGRRPVLLMAGEIILGGKQNRIVREDVLLPGRSGFIDVSVYCGEQDRWRGVGKTFESAQVLTAPSLRRMAAGAASQDRIWREIDTKLSDAEVRSSTRSYHEMYEAPEVKRRLDPYVREFDGIARSRTVGVVVLAGGRVLGIDVFSDDDLFARLWPKICRSYAAEVTFPTLRPEARRWPVPGFPGIRRLLDSIREADFSERGTPGLGTLWQLRGDMTGNDLEYDGEVIHAGLFPRLHYIQPLR